ncbi:DUF177 domain-containing protein [Candidatus Sumerlaeota bacterium]|nr:DUF177 domain-containing protein [Candidatus Sumerlaeota bacterium]
METLRIDLLRLREGNQVLTLNHSPKLFDLDDEEWTFTDRVTGEIEFHLTDQRDIFARGVIRAKATGRCGWCLDPVPVDVEATFRYIYLPASQEPTDDVSIEHVNEGEPDVAYYGGEFVETLDQLRETILLALPHLPLRSEDGATCLTCKRDLTQPPHREGWPEEASEEDEPEWKRKLKELRGG